MEDKKYSYIPYNISKKDIDFIDDDNVNNSKSINSDFDNNVVLGARGVAWHPSTLGW